MFLLICKKIKRLSIKKRCIASYYVDLHKLSANTFDITTNIHRYYNPNISFIDLYFHWILNIQPKQKHNLHKDDQWCCGF